MVRYHVRYRVTQVSQYQELTLRERRAMDEVVMDGDDGSASAGVSDEDLETCVRVLRALATEDGAPSDEYRSPRCKALRCAMQLFLDDASSRQFHGQRPDKYAQRKEKKRQQNAREQQQRALDRDAANKTRMRAERLRVLGELEAAAADVLEDGHLALTDGDATHGGGSRPRLEFVPDGAVETDAGVPAGVGLHLTDRQTGEDGERDERGGEVVGEGGESGGPTVLRTLHACYICKGRYRVLHHFYASLCPACAELNYTKRVQVAPLAGRTFLVTGGRVKIGYQASAHEAALRARPPPHTHTHNHSHAHAHLRLAIRLDSTF